MDVLFWDWMQIFCFVYWMNNRNVWDCLSVSTARSRAVFIFIYICTLLLLVRFIMPDYIITERGNCPKTRSHFFEFIRSYSLWMEKVLKKNDNIYSYYSDWVEILSCHFRFHSHDAITWTCWRQNVKQNLSLTKCRIAIVILRVAWKTWTRTAKHCCEKSIAEEKRKNVTFHLSLHRNLALCSGKNSSVSYRVSWISVFRSR